MPQMCLQNALLEDPEDSQKHKLQLVPKMVPSIPNASKASSKGLSYVPKLKNPMDSQKHCSQLVRKGFRPLHPPHAPKMFPKVPFLRTQVRNTWGLAKNCTTHPIRALTLLSSKVPKMFPKAPSRVPEFEGHENSQKYCPLICLIRVPTLLPSPKVWKSSFHVQAPEFWGRAKSLPLTRPIRVLTPTPPLP